MILKAPISEMYLESSLEDSPSSSFSHQGPPSFRFHSSPLGVLREKKYVTIYNMFSPQLLTTLFLASMFPIMTTAATVAPKARRTTMKSTTLCQDFLLKKTFGVKATTRMNTCQEEKKYVSIWYTTITSMRK